MIQTCDFSNLLNSIIKERVTMFFFQNNVTILSMIRCLTFLFENKPGNIVSRDTIEILTISFTTKFHGTHGKVSTTSFLIHDP